jgi:anti-anti-sigma regulatory factor
LPGDTRVPKRSAPKGAKEIDVLKITRTETPLEEKWILQGRLVGLWVSELRRTWKKTHRADKNLKCVIDLNEVTFIDVKGERLLRTMSKEGAQLVATGMYIKHVLQQWCAR